jgi:hypothetical protein
METPSRAYPGDTPHYGQAKDLHAARACVLDAAYARNPERFVRQPPVPPELPTAAWINKPETKEVAHEIPTRTVSLDLTGSGRADARVELGLDLGGPPAGLPDRRYDGRLLGGTGLVQLVLQRADLRLDAVELLLQWDAPLGVPPPSLNLLALAASILPVWCRVNPVRPEPARSGQPRTARGAASPGSAVDAVHWRRSRRRGRSTSGAAAPTRSSPAAAPPRTVRLTA